MATEVILPRVDMDMTSGRIARWFVGENARVEKGQPLFEIETDKAAMEVEAPAAGILRGVAGAEGAELPVGSTVAWIVGEGEAEPVMPVSSGATLPGEAAPERPAGAAAAEERGAASEPAAPPRGTRRRPATPLARRRARERGMDFAALAGSGPHGRIQARDVPAAAPPAAAPQAEAAPLHSAWLRQGEGVPLVLLHGFGGDLNGWRPFLAGGELAAPVLGVDLPGHGQSTLAATPSLESFAASVAETLRAQGIRACHLVGHSLGAAVAAAAAAGPVLTVRSLLLLAPAGLGPQINGAFLEGFVRARSQASLAAWMGELVADAAALDPAFVRATARQREGAAIREAQERVVAALFPDGAQAFSIRDTLAGIEAPVKLIWGTADRIIPASHARGVPGRIALHIFPGLGHMPQMEAGPEVRRLLAELIRAAG